MLTVDALWAQTFMPTITRRHFLGSTGALFVLTSCTRSGRHRSPQLVRASVVHVIAHPDDDLLFMNPDITEAIRAGDNIATICITSGEADVADPAARAAYVQRRRLGARAAYAMMAGVADEWSSEVLSLVQGREVEVLTLREMPTIHLAYIGVPDTLDPDAPGALNRLWLDERASVETVQAEPASTAKATYARRDLVAMLVALFEHFQPTLIRTLDQAPDARLVDEPEWQPLHDHSDHVRTAQFVDLAVRAYADADAAMPAIVNYRGYNLDEVDPNLASAQASTKRAIVTKYLEHDERAQMTSRFERFTRSQRYRWPRGASWVVRGRGGTLNVFAVLGGRLWCWSRDGGEWTNAQTIGTATNLVSSVSAVADGGKRLHVFVRTLNHSILTIANAPDGSWRGDFRDLGSPNPPSGPNDLGPTQIGVPLGIVIGSGLPAVVVKNAGGGLSSKIDWNGGWTDLGGFDVQDGLTATTSSDGHVELYASTRFKILRWSQARFDQPFVLDTLAADKPLSMPALARTTKGVAIAYRTANGEIAVLMPGASAPLVVPGACGPGDPALIASDQKLVIFARDFDGGVVASEQLGEHAFSPYTPIGGSLIDGATAILDHAGAIMLFGVDRSGHVALNHQHRAGALITFGGWRTLDN
jgi:LmbE family N-acetylglucosaminyl deacetylase